MLVFLLPGLEAAIFVGVVFPGEIAVLLGGVAAAQGSVSIALVLVAASLGAVLGDQVGYLVGREWGETVLRKIPDRLLDENQLQKGRAYVRRMGAKGVILGRWTAALRALVPGLAGMSRMSYPRFLVANIVGGVGWAVTVGAVGYLAGDSYKKVESALGSVSYVILGLVAVGPCGSPPPPSPRASRDDRHPGSGARAGRARRLTAARRRPAPDRPVDNRHVTAGVPLACYATV